MPFRSFAADDIFISYTRLDASTYAAGLADALTKKGFSCFIDKLGTDPDKDLPGMLRRKIKSCAMLVIVGTERAGTRQTIEDEVKEFLLTGRRSSIVPIDFGGAVYKANWYGLVEGVAPEPEKNTNALDDGEPSPSVISRIEKQFKYTRRNQRLRRITIGTAALLALLLLASVAAGVYAKRQIEAASEAGARAEQARAEAVVARGEAEAAKNEATTERQAAQAAKTEADAARTDAIKQKDIAGKATHEAELKTKLADDAARRAADADKAARAAKAEADHQQTIAGSRSLANRSQTLLRQHPDEVPNSVSVAVQALKTGRTVEADTALRESLSLLPRLRRPAVIYEADIIDTAFSPDGLHFATLSSDKKLRIYETGSQTPLYELPCECSALALSNGPAYAAVLSATGVEIFDLKNGGRRTVKLVESEPSATEAAAEEAPLEGESAARIAISPGGRYLALVFNTGEDVGIVSLLKILDATTGKVVQTLLKDSSLKANDLAFGSSGNLAIGGSEQGPHGLIVGRAIIWPLSAKLGQGEADATLTAQDFFLSTNVYQDEAIKVVAPGADDSYLATDRVVLKRDASREFEPMARIPLPAGNGQDYVGSGVDEYAVENVAFNAAGDRLEVVRRYPTPIDDKTFQPGSYKGLEEWDAAGYWEAARVPLLPVAIDIASSPLGEVVAASFDADPSEALNLFRTADGSEVAASVKTLSLQVDLVSPETIPALLTFNEGTAEIRGGRAQMMPAHLTPELRDTLDAAITPDGKFLALAGEDVGFYVLENGAYRLSKLLTMPEPMARTALSPDGQILVTQTVEAHVVQVWRTGDGHEITPAGLRKLTSPTTWRLSPGGRFLAVTGYSNEGFGIYVWRLADGAPLGPIKLPEYKHPEIALTFSPHEHFLLSAGPFSMTGLLDLLTGHVWNVPVDATVTTTAFSPDERFFGVGTEEGFLLVFPTNAPDNEIARLRHVGRVAAVAFSADGRRLVTASARSNPYGLREEEKFPLRVWLLPPEDLLDEAGKLLSELPDYARSVRPAR